MPSNSTSKRKYSSRVLEEGNASKRKASELESKIDNIVSQTSEYDTTPSNPQLGRNLKPKDSIGPISQQPSPIPSSDLPVIYKRQRKCSKPLANRIFSPRATPQSFKQKTKPESKATLMQLVGEVKKGLNIVSLSVPPEGHTFIVIVDDNVIRVLDHRHTYVYNLRQEPGKNIENELDLSNQESNHCELNDDKKLMKTEYNNQLAPADVSLLSSELAKDRSMGYRAFFQLLSKKFSLPFIFELPLDELKSDPEYQKRLKDGGACMYYSELYVNSIGFQ